MPKKQKKRSSRVPQKSPREVISQSLDTRTITSTKKIKTETESNYDSINTYRGYALRLVAFSVGLKLLLSGGIGVFWVPTLDSGSVKVVPYGSFILPILLGLIPFKAFIIYPALVIAMFIRVNIWNMIVLSRILFGINLILTTIFFYGLGYSQGIFDRLYSFLLRTSPDQVHNQLPGWIKASLAFFTSSILGAIVLWGLTSWAWDAIKWIIARAPWFFTRLLRAPQVITSSHNTKK